MRFVHQGAETSTVSQGQQIHRAYNALDLANDMQGPLSQERIEIVSGGKFGGGTGKTATSRHIAVNVCRKSGYGNPLRNELTDDSKWVVAPAFIVLRPQVRHGNFNPASDF